MLTVKEGKKTLNSSRPVCGAVRTRVIHAKAGILEPARLRMASNAQWEEPGQFHLSCPFPEARASFRAARVKAGQPCLLILVLAELSQSM